MSETLRRPAGVSITDLGDPVEVWQETHTMNWEDYGTIFKDSTPLAHEKLGADWKLVRILSIKSNKDIVAQRVKEANLFVEHSQIFEGTQKLDTQIDMQYAKFQFSMEVGIAELIFTADSEDNLAEEHHQDQKCTTIIEELQVNCFMFARFSNALRGVNGSSLSIRKKMRQVQHHHQFLQKSRKPM